MKRRISRIGGAAAFATAALLVLHTNPAAADSIGTGISEFGEDVVGAEISLNILWIILGAALVIFMQAGFALVETGFCRAKHAAHVVMTNFAIFGLGFVGFFIVGFGIMFGAFSSTIGADAVPVIGDGAYTSALGEWLVDIDGFGGIFAWATPALGSGGYDVAVMAFFLYLCAFMDTVATIPTGAMAERWNFKSFMVWGLFCGAIYYPLFGAWTWGGGWLSQLGNNFDLGLGYVDFAGSGVVHAMGGLAALAGAKVIGPRIGKFNKDGSANSIPGHHLPMATLGTFILLFGWFGFNAASTFAATDARFAVAAANTGIAAAFGATAALFYAYFRVGKPDPGIAINGMLAGLVAITAPCAFVQPWAAAVIGAVAAIVVTEAIWFVEKKLKIDDPVGAIGVHGVGGIFGVLCVGVFADGSYGAGWNATGNALAEPLGKGVTGIFYGDAGQLGAQVVGVLTLVFVMLPIAYGFFKIQDKLTKGGIRSAEADEVAGLDLPEMGVLAYPEFEMAIEASDPEIGERPLIGATKGHIPDHV
ncbi:MAG TPA: ammonium transporter [Acidimicrobiales bacterium]|nr:ammonium transporter [Acidimicrobiales bacterium]